MSLAGGAFAGLSRDAVEAAVPDRLLGSTVRAALGYTSVGGAPGEVPASVAALAEGVLKMMILTRLSVLVASMMVVGMAGLTACVVWAAVPAGPDEPPEARVVVKADEPVARDRDITGIDARRARVHGVVVNDAGKPVAGIEVRDFGEPQAQGVTDERGRFDFRVRRPLLNGMLLLAGTADRTRQGTYRYDFDLLEAETKPPIQIVLKPSREVVVRVTDKAGVPVPGAAVETIPSYAVTTTDDQGTVSLRLPADAGIGRIIGLKSGRGFDDYQHGELWDGDPARELPGRIHLVLDGARTVRVRAIDTAGKPLAGIRFAPQVIRKIGKRDANVFTESSEIARSVTDERGVATFDWLPPTTDPVYFVPTSEGYHTVERPALQEQTGTTVTVQLLRDGTIRGRLVRPDGKPAAGILVMTEEGGDRAYTSLVRVRTAGDGSYEMTVLSNTSYTVAVADDEWSAPSHVDVKVMEGQPVEGLDFRLGAAPSSTGRSRSGRTGGRARGGPSRSTSSSGWVAPW